MKATQPEEQQRRRHQPEEQQRRDQDYYTLGNIIRQDQRKSRRTATVNSNAVTKTVAQNYCIKGEQRLWTDH